MEFEFDPNKSRANKLKHGIDFEQAQELWSDPHGTTGPAKSEIEPRESLTAEWKGKVWTAFYTFRGRTIRIISVRRARAGEAQVYVRGRP